MAPSISNRSKGLGHDGIDSAGLPRGLVVEPAPERLHGNEDGAAGADVREGGQERSEGALGEPEDRRGFLGAEGQSVGQADGLLGILAHGLLQVVGRTRARLVPHGEQGRVD